MFSFEFLCSSLSSGPEFQVATVILFSHSLACVSIVTNPDIIPFYMLALRAAIRMRHSCWGLGRNRSRGWELDCGSMETFAYHDVGSDFTLFRFPYPPLPSTYWLWELVRERPPAAGGFWASTGRARAGSGHREWLGCCRLVLPSSGKAPPSLIPSCSRVGERTDIRTDGHRGN